MKKLIQTDGAPEASSILSQAVVAGGFVFVSGQIHQTLEGDVTGGSVSDKIAQIMLNLGVILMTAGSSLKDVVKATI
jgi:2-iminobutanoate/2-iminopropanoate deaminase